MVTAEELQKAFNLAYYVHPDEEIAWGLTWEACEHGVLALRNEQAERLEKADAYQRKGREGWKTYRPYKLALRAENLLQIAMYRVSLKYERTQEQTHSHILTPDDLCIRYIKHLIWKGIEQNPCHVAVGLGRFLYTYELDDIGALEATWPREKNLERAEQRIGGWLTDRFGTLGMRSLANEDERTLVQASLSMFVPWFPPCTPVPAQPCDTAYQAYISQHVFQAYFMSDEPAETAWQQIHVLIHPCVGMGQLIRVSTALNEEKGAMASHDPDTTLRLPTFGAPDASPPAGAGSPTLRDRLHPPPLTPRDLRALRETLERHRGRRRRFRASARPLRIEVDGQEIGQVGVSETPVLSIPLAASFVEVFGRDREGDLRLAVFSLPELEGEGSGVRQRVTLEGGQTVALEIMPGYDETTGEVSQGLMRIVYEEPVAVYTFPLPSEEACAVAASSEIVGGVQGLPGQMMYQDEEVEVWVQAECGRVILYMYGRDLQGLGALAAFDCDTLETYPVVTIACAPTEVVYALGSTQALRGKIVRLSLQLNAREIELPHLELTGEGTP